MKFWQKMLVVVVSGGSIWGISFLASVKPDMAMMLASVNVAIMSVCSYLTGFPAPKEV
jgi:hypothetical protein